MDESIQGEIFDLLFNLQESGKVNIMGAREYIKIEYYELSDTECKEYLQYWMTHYAELKKVRDNDI